VVVVRGDRRRLAASVPAPALGATVVRPVEADSGSHLSGSVVVDDRSISNDLIHVSIDPDGTVTLESDGVRLVGVGRLVDGGDFGDTYNYGAPASDRLIERPSTVVTKAIEHGPLRGAVEIVARYDWPVGLQPGGETRSETTAPVELTTRLELRAGEPFVRVKVSFVNPARDHRLRYHVPLPAPAGHSSAEGQFAVVDRGLTAEAGHGEVPTAIFPAHGFVHAAGVSVLLDHVTEYELVDGLELALTVLRSTGLISRNDNPFREDPAGPEVAVPDAQLLGPWQFTFAIQPHGGDWEAAGIPASAEGYHLPFVTAAGRAAEDRRPVSSPGLTVTGRGVVLSALRRQGEELEIRLVAETSDATEATVAAPGRIERVRDVDLLGRDGQAVPLSADGTLTVPLGPWEIRTIRLSVARP
jgi:alpha-mannosidase